MLDMKFIRENPDAVKRGAELKGMKVDVDRLLAIDAEKRGVVQKLQELQTEQNKASKELGPLMGQLKKETDAGKKAELEKKIEAMKSRPSAIKGEMAGMEERIRTLDLDLDILQLTIPQPPDDDVPIGKSAEDNIEILKWGEPRKFDFEPKSHIDLGKSLGLFDVDRGVKMAGSRSYVMTGAGALLHNAVLRMAQDFMIHEQGFTPMSIPVLVREGAMRGTGFFPAGREQAYRVGEVNDPAEEVRFLTGTGEVGLTAYHMDEILHEADLPKKYVTMSTCFRREAGTYGKDTTGLYRIHQFDKVEQVVICKNDKEESKMWHRKMLSFSEEMLKRLKLPYRLLQCCTGDLGVKNASMIDVETWMPSRNGYGETHS
ncbi:MAG TPA: serine--tRNA ligase, partial [Phycisphaerae bacterium]|nr:serine--tRNA ligase [Phycisphaerae bacterium]